MENPVIGPGNDFKNTLRKSILLGFLAGLLIAIYELFVPNSYRSQALLLPVEAKGASGGLGQLFSAAATFGIDVPSGDGSDANFVDVLKSRSLRQQLLNTTFEFHVRSWRFGTEHAMQTTLYSYLGCRNMDQALTIVAPIFSALRDPKSKIITISAETKSPELSQQIVKRAQELLESFLQKRGQTRGGTKAAFSEARLADARKDMDMAEATFRNFLEKNRNFTSSADPTVRLMGSRLETELKLRQQLVATLAVNREQALIEEKNDMPILNVLDPANLPIQKSKPARLIAVIIGMLGVCAASWLLFNREWLRSKVSFDPQNLAGEGPLNPESSEKLPT